MGTATSAVALRPPSQPRMPTSHMVSLPPRSTRCTRPGTQPSTWQPRQLCAVPALGCQVISRSSPGGSLRTKVTGKSEVRPGSAAYRGRQGDKWRARSKTTRYGSDELTMSIVFAGTIERTSVPESSLATACSAILAWGLWAATVRCCWVSTEASTAMSIARSATGIHVTTALPRNWTPPVHVHD